MILLEILLGLAFVYFAAATFCSLLQEWIATHTLARAKLLRTAIERMIGVNATLAVYSHPMVDTASEAHDRPPSYLPAETFARAMLDSLRSAGEWSKPIDMVDVRTALQQIDHLPLRDALASLCGAAGDDIAALEKGLAAWYDQVMDRASGWYKRHARGMLFLLGFCTAVAFNLDTFRIVSRLWSDAALRTELAGAAEQQVQDAKGKVPSPTLDQARATLGKLPFGWGASLPTWQDLTTWSVWTQNLRALGRAVVTGLCGWLVTALAVSLGGPFWFELMTRVVDIRGAGKKPAPAKPATSGGDES